MICWVRSARPADASVGSASASSLPLVCRLWHPPEHRGQGLERHPDDVVVGLLGGERHAPGLDVEAQVLGLRVLHARTGPS